MNAMSNRQKVCLTLAMLAAPVSVGVSAQQVVPQGEVLTTVLGSPPADLEGLTEGPEVKGFIASRDEDALQIVGADGADTQVRISDGTEIRASGGFLGINRQQLGADALLNGLPVTVRTVQWNGGLVATRIKFKNSDFKTASLVRNGTAQQFAQQGAAINQNAAATEALRGRFGDIDQYNVKGTTNVYFDTGKFNLSARAENELCSVAAQAEQLDSALLLVVGYTDSTGSYEINQELSEKRAGRVVNYLQQQCGWKPYRMLTPTGLAASDPAADNSTDYGRSQNRRVAVNILVSKSVEGL